MGIGVGVPVAAKISANFRIAPMVWMSKRAKGVGGAVLDRSSASCLAASVASLAEDIAVMAPLWRKTLLFLLCALHMSLAHR